MIVDDEEPVLESFSYLLKKGIPGFELCGVARSGPEAIASVPELKPDLVFMDIQMQGMDGIEAVANIQKSHPGIIFILSTAYERFDIAQKAIPLGVFNYLVKPVSRKALMEEFSKVKAQLDELGEKDAIRLKEAHFVQQMRDEEMRRFLFGLSWASPGERDWREFARLFSVKGDSGAVMLLKIANPLPEAELGIAYQDLIRRLQYKSACLAAVIAGQMIVLFPEGDGEEKIERRVEKALEGAASLDVRFGLGALRHFSGLRESYREAFEQLQALGGPLHSPARERQEVRDLCEKFLYADWDQVMPLYDEYWTDVFMRNDFPVARAKMIAFFSRLMDALDQDLKIRVEIDIDPAREIVGLSALQQWQQWSSFTMERLKSIIRENKDLYFPKPLGLAVSYIKENYAKPLQLSSVAQKCEISQGYLSRLFSECLNTTFIDYLNTLRINEAVKLLRNERKSVKEVTYLVGYNDPNYFSRIFRRYLKVSPSELAKRGGNNEE
jgi:two-component system, response regulator YesN